MCGLQPGVVSNGFMLVWTQVFRARLTGGRHARFAVTHETLLVRALVSSPKRADVRVSCVRLHVHVRVACACLCLHMHADVLRMRVELSY